MRRTAVSIVAALALLAVLPGTSGARPVHPDAPFITSEPPMLVALQPGVDITPIISAGDLIGGSLGGFQYSAALTGSGSTRARRTGSRCSPTTRLSYRYGDPA